MAQVVVTIAGRTYRMNCEDGQEGHIEELAAQIDAKMGGLKTSFGEIGEQRLVVMAALTIADELSEAKARIARLEGEISALNADGLDQRDALAARDDRFAGTLGEAAHRLENLARMLAGKG